MKLLNLTLALIISLTFLLSSCKKDNPVPPEEQPQINLTLEDVSCTEAWIKLSTGNLILPASVDLLKDSSFAKTINLTSADTILYLDSLLPNKTYSFNSIIQSSNRSIFSDPLQVTTMDTTSHNFTWQSWTFGGQAGSCTLYDVAIIDENNIWAVGEIYLLDTLGQPDPTRYNLVVWNGNDWEVKRVPYYYQGQPFYNPIQSVFAFSPTDIWFCGNGVIHWDGNLYVPIPIPSNVWRSYQMNKIWGTSDNDLYVVGNNGNIAHYDGQSWSRIESGTDLDINDIYGAYNGNTSEWEILAVASDYPESISKEILHLRNNSAAEISSDPIMWPVFSVWFVPNRIYYVAGSGIYQKHLLDYIHWKNNVLDITTFTTTSICGNGINDVAAVGAFGDLVHFNGVNWKNDYEEPLLNNGSYTNVTIKGDLLVAVGSNQISINSEAVILMGIR